MGENVLLLRFNDHDSDDLVRPVDAVGNLAELVKTGAAYPAIVEAELGYGRQFVSADLDGLSAADLDSGATLLTRNASIQVALSWDLVATGAAGIATIYARGKGTAAAEYVSAGLELRVIDVASRIGEIRWIWQDLAGALKTQIGGHFQPPADGELVITATRRWVSSSSVVLRYYLGDTLLAEVESVDGEIGGGTTGTTSIGARYNAAGAAWFRHFDGVIDELRVVDDEITEEEVRATWRRITVDQPNGYRLVQQAHDPGFPISRDPASRVQRETRLWGHGLGFAAAQAENVRENILPDRAYGAVLSRWEAITKQSPASGDDAFTRRRRVVGKIRQRLGASIPGIEDALDELLDTDPVNLSFLAFDNTTTDTWETLNTPRWRHDPAAQWTIAANHLRVQSAGDRSAWMDWYTSLMSIQGNGRGGAIVSKFTPTTIQTQGEVGLVFSDRASNNAILFGYRNDAGTYRLVTQRMVDGVLGHAIDRVALGGLVPVWLTMANVDDGSLSVVNLGSDNYTPTGAAIYSSTALIAGDGYVEATTSAIDPDYDWGAIGVTIVDPSAAIADSTWSFFAWSNAGDGHLYIDGDGGEADLGAIMIPGATLRIGRAGGTNEIHVWQNDTIVYTFSTTTAAPLFGIVVADGSATAVRDVRVVVGSAEVDLDDWIERGPVAVVRGGNFALRYSTVSGSGPWTDVAIEAPGFAEFQWAGFYARTFSATAANIDVAIDDTKVRAPYGDRPFRFYVVRDPAAPGNPDFLGSNAVLRGLRQAQTLGLVVRTAVALYDDDSTGYDLEPCGGV